ncbi:MFS transporter [Kitasatospora phosalacinea]|uniref:MFS transporter n=1 Tax=Kitasatospora phosalacinea TaxID=2065 RepID=A0ABW6GVA8_9ACTN
MEHTARASGTPCEKPDVRPGALLAALLTAVGSYALMQTMVVPALPVLTRQLHAAPGTSAWLVTAFLLGSAVLTPVVSSLGSRYGNRRMLLVSLTVYLLSTLAAATAPGLGFLIAMRAVEGIGMATLPLALTVIRDRMPPRRMVSGFGLTSAMIGGGSGAGLVVGGLLIDNFSWRWMFGAEAVLILAAVVLVAMFVPAGHPRGWQAPAGRVDLLGAATLAAALASLLLGVTRGNSWGWSSTGVLGLFAAAALLLLLFGLVESRSPSPLADLRVLGHPPVLLTNLASLLLGAVPFVFYVLVPQILQTAPSVAPYGDGLSVVESGLLLLPSTVCVVIAGKATPWVRHRLGTRAPLAVSMALMTAGAAAIGVWHDRPAQIGVLFCLIGLGSGFGFAAVADLTAQLVPRTELASANGFNTVVRTVGSAVGGQLASVFLLTWTTPDTPVPSEHAYTVGFWTAAFLAAAGIVLTALLRVEPYPTPPATAAPRAGAETAHPGPAAPHRVESSARKQ